MVNLHTESDVVSQLRLKGYTINRKRLAFIEGVCALKTIDNPETLWFYLKNNHTKISIAAVYNNLKLMVDEGIMTKVENDTRRNSYWLMEKP